MSRIEPLSYEQTQYLASICHDLSPMKLREALDEFVCDYGYDESEHDDMDYETVAVSYVHRVGTMKEVSA